MVMGGSLFQGRVPLEVEKQIAMAVFIVLRHRRDAFRARTIWISARQRNKFEFLIFFLYFKTIWLTFFKKLTIQLLSPGRSDWTFGLKFMKIHHVEGSVGICGRTVHHIGSDPKDVR
jgi:hypothetical protein